MRIVDFADVRVRDAPRMAIKKTNVRRLGVTMGRDQPITENP
jgi:hypothetical protein